MHSCIRYEGFADAVAAANTTNTTVVIRFEKCQEEDGQVFLSSILLTDLTGARRHGLERDVLTYCE